MAAGLVATGLGWLARRALVAMIADALKLSVYFGDSLMTGDAPASDVLDRALAARGLRVAALMRGVEGFGINRRIHAERFPDVSTDLPLLAMAVDERVRDRVAARRRRPPRCRAGWSRSSAPASPPAPTWPRRSFPDGPGAAAKLTIYCATGRVGRNGRPTFRDAVDLLRTHGATGAIVLLGVDGVVRGRRAKARLFAGQRGRADGDHLGRRRPTSLQRCLPHLRPSVSRPGRDVRADRAAQARRRDARAAAGAAMAPRTPRRLAHAARLQRARSAQVDGRALHAS